MSRTLSFELLNVSINMMTELELKIYEIVRTIPKGKVMTYGQVAQIAGDKHLARVVGNVMHKNPVPFWQLAREVGFASKEPGIEWKDFEAVPCHRVVNSSGNMGANFGMGGPEVQAKMLRAEGIEVVNNKVSIEVYGFKRTGEKA